MLNIKVTDKALVKLKDYGVGQDRFLRVTVKPGGCSGFKFDAYLEEEKGEEDKTVYENGDIQIIADSPSSLFLNGLEIDFSDDFIKGGFRFTNTMAAGSCGCGASFEA